MSLKLGSTNIAGTQVLYSTTGNNTDGAMTQAITTTQLNLKANNADVVHKTGNEMIGGVKTFTGNVVLPVNTLIKKDSDQYEGGELQFEVGTGSSLTGTVKIDVYHNNLRFFGSNSRGIINLPLQIDIENNEVAVSTPSISDNSVKAINTSWVNTKFPLVSTLPANPDSNIYYFIPE